MTTFIQFQMRRDTAANWSSANPVLGQGELGLDTSVLRFKIGDGVTVWNSLAYAPNTVFAGTGAPSAGLGVNGDLYFDTTAGATKIYGPKAAGAWGSGVTLTGATGAPGGTGPAGPGVPTGGAANNGLFKIDATNFNTQWLTPTQMTALFDAATLTLKGLMSAADKKKLDRGYTDLVNELGADATGNVDATAIITAWLAGTTSGTLFLPPNCRVRVDGPVAWNKECNFLGGERRTSILSCGNATNNMFDVTADGVTFENLRFSAGAAGTDNAALRTAGYALNFDTTSDSSGARKCDILFQWSGIHSSGSLQYMEDQNIREYGNNAPNGNCILIDGVGDRYIRRVTTDNGSNPTGFAGIRVKTCASLVISDCNIIHAGNALELSPGAGQTVPSVEAVNCFFDTSVNGLAVVPTGTGVVARGKFTGCWFGTHTTNGILLTNPGGATSSFEGLQFVNCDIYGCPTGINASAGGGKWEFSDGAIAGCTTQAITLGPSAAHFPKITNNVIGPHGLFGANALGIVITTGTFKGILIQGNSVVNNTGASLTLGLVTTAAGEASFYKIIDNAGINPRGSSLAPAVPASTVAVTNTFGFPAHIYIRAGTITVISINGIPTGITAAPSATGTYLCRLSPGGTIAMTFSVAPTWIWISD